MGKDSRLVTNVVLGIGSAMLAATVVQQMPGRLYARIREHDHFAFIPSWSFFAPNPATRDYEPLHRLIHGDGVRGPWTYTLGSRERLLSENLWAPRRRLSKAIFDMTTDLLPLIQERDIDVMETVPAYTGIRDYVIRLAREQKDPSISAVQFLVTLHGGYDESEKPEILFVSREHTLQEGNS